MAEELRLTEDATKEETYREILPQIRSLLEGESDLIANLANICAVLTQAFGHLWTGFYIRQGDELVLGPFQGPLACTRIPLKPVARGVCGAAAEAGETLVVPDVDKFPGHIACSSLSKSEIVVPLVVHGRTMMVLDVDSTETGTFDETDRMYLEQVVDIVKERHLGP
ncbi:MAG: GAF domain-containing protein [Alphaproteobacteria bacterium]|nr:GAF domain-containing protein [Alphaproteobacteria bacterium]